MTKYWCIPMEWGYFIIIFYKTTSFYYQYDIKMCKKIGKYESKIWEK